VTTASIIHEFTPSQGPGMVSRKAPAKPDYSRDVPYEKILANLNPKVSDRIDTTAHVFSSAQLIAFPSAIAGSPPIYSARSLLSISIHHLRSPIS
jgi:hypothetical protein